MTIINGKDESSQSLITEFKKLNHDLCAKSPNENHIANMISINIEDESELIKNEDSLTCESSSENNGERDPLSFENEVESSMQVVEIDNEKNNIICKSFENNARDCIPKLLMWSHKTILPSQKDDSDITKKKRGRAKKYPDTFTCEFCGKNFTGKDHAYEFYHHRNREHTHEMVYKCHICMKKFWGDRELAAHITIHKSSGHICHICGTKFTAKKNLNKHILIHSDKSFSCEYCNKSFTRKDHLKVHERIHTGFRPYQCEKCDSGFIQKRQLKLHMKNCPLNEKTNSGNLNQQIDLTNLFIFPREVR